MASELDGRKIPVATLVRDWGTPLFVYDADVLRDRFEQLRDLLDERLTIFYSLKANPNIAIAALFRSFGAGAEVSSHTELVTALRAGFAPADIVFVGPGKSRDELDAVLRYGIYATVCESMQELAMLDELARAHGVKAPAAIRVNPQFIVEGARQNMAGKPRQFGIDEEQLPDDLVHRFPNLHIRGVHVYAGTRILSEPAIANATARILDLAERLTAAWGCPLEFVDVGGGIGVAYFEGENDIDSERLAALVNPVIQRFAARHPGTRLVTELGRYLTAPAGIYLTTIRYTKTSKGRNFAVADGGVNHHHASTGLGSVLTRDFPIRLLTRPDEPATTTWTVTGPLCTPADTLVHDASLPPLQPGDLMAIPRCGAYGPSASPVLFLGHGHPAEILLHQGQSHLIRTRDGSDDILRPHRLPEFLHPGKNMSHNDAQITETITTALRPLLDDPDTPIHYDTRILDDLGVDSTTILRLLLRLEDEFHVEFDPDALFARHFATLADLTAYVRKHVELGC
ncbi:phosphopantetheine-binding protein [Streptomyces virginiae]|uniref:phosphopantetheine-binding protein n=1 Tax=Streptomyces virginiae TaxID=1961 RepID=UPI0036C68373